jgi:hypothetical protein
MTEIRGFPANSSYGLEAVSTSESNRSIDFVYRTDYTPGLEKIDGIIRTIPSINPERSPDFERLARLTPQQQPDRELPKGDEPKKRPQHRLRYEVLPGYGLKRTLELVVTKLKAEEMLTKGDADLILDNARTTTFFDAARGKKSLPHHSRSKQSSWVRD